MVHSQPFSRLALGRPHKREFLSSRASPDSRFLTGLPLIVSFNVDVLSAPTPVLIACSLSSLGGVALEEFGKVWNGIGSSLLHL